jgi:hypothetical protein
VGTRPPWAILFLVVVGILLALYIGSQVLGVLVAILFPPVPPLPPTAVQLRHQSAEHGLDEWEYVVSFSPCETVAHFEAGGTACEVVPGFCRDTGNLPSTAGQYVATCTGEMTFSIFAMRWDAVITSAETPEQTYLTLEREVFWTGAVPPREFPLPESGDLGDN